MTEGTKGILGWLRVLGQVNKGRRGVTRGGRSEKPWVRDGAGRWEGCDRIVGVRTDVGREVQVCVGT